MDALTLATFERGPLAGAVIITVIAGATPTASAARVQTIVGPDGGPQLQPAPEALAFVAPAGRVSVTLRSDAALGPAFRTVRV